MSPATARGRERSGLKVLLLVSDLEDYTIAFTNGLAHHVDVILAVPRRQYTALADWIDPSVDLRLLDWPRHRSPANIGLIAALWRLVRREHPDVIHILSNNTLWLNLVVPFWRGIPVVTTIHDVTLHPGDRETATLPAWAPRLMARQSAHIVVHGDGLKAHAVEVFRKDGRAVHVLPHPAMPRYALLAEREGLRRRSDGTFRVLMFGRIFAYKGLDLLMRAENLLRDMPDLRIVVAGRGDDPMTMRNRMGDPTKYDIRHRFILDREVAQLFLDADIVVLPYSEASQSGVLHLAGTFSRPVVATEVGEVGPAVRDHDLGLVVPVADAQALASAIRRLAGDAALRGKLGQRAQEWAQGDNSPRAIGAKSACLYRSIIDGGMAS
ncbi:glycosyltransferase family 4 protein (plasmid) [Paracoccus liaowanqingii]|uniref:Glycosyltransferase family 4 protein n=1 Tax=Paracoccus liaowanqingii TaxID=2560053 RepID=A0A4Y5SSA9_9RHOB|nr:glycosyltransferase family 4 protein [Paracoccus liaowanqingii]QDA35823.1 glycosyltransferase family 4 protein [Paracoccus liaowanqingii]